MGAVQENLLLYAISKKHSSLPSVAICAIQKGDLNYIDEWITYNLALGFEKIYLYDNSDDFEVNNWYISQTWSIRERVAIQHIPGVRKQLPAYNHCWDHVRNRSSHSWIAFIDLDEFPVIRDVSLHPKIIDFLEALPRNYSALAVNWVMFGFNNNMKFEKRPVTLRFQRRRQHATHSLVKVFVRAKVPGVMQSAHYVKYKTSPPLVTRDTRGNAVTGAHNTHKADETIAIYHYHTKSFEEFKLRCSRGDVAKKRKQWGNALPCQSKEEIMAAFAYNETVFDDATWKLLQHRAPEYTRAFENNDEQLSD